MGIGQIGLGWNMRTSCSRTHWPCCTLYLQHQSQHGSIWNDAHFGNFHEWLSHSWCSCQRGQWTLSRLYPIKGDLLQSLYKQCVSQLILKGMVLWNLSRVVCIRSHWECWENKWEDNFFVLHLSDIDFMKVCGEGINESYILLNIPFILSNTTNECILLVEVTLHHQELRCCFLKFYDRLFLFFLSWETLILNYDQCKQSHLAQPYPSSRVTVSHPSQSDCESTNKSNKTETEINTWKERKSVH